MWGRSARAVRRRRGWRDGEERTTLQRESGKEMAQDASCYTGTGVPPQAPRMAPQALGHAEGLDMGVAAVYTLFGAPFSWGHSMPA